jgi:hypothetical protein
LLIPLPAYYIKYVRIFSRPSLEYILWTKIYSGLSDQNCVSVFIQNLGAQGITRLFISV